MHVVQLNLQESSVHVIDECMIFWGKAKIPTQDPANVVKTVKKLYDCWRNLDKNQNL